MSKETIFAILAMTAATTRALNASASDLPEDAPLTPQIMHKVKYPLADSNHIDAGISFVYGDKFLNTRGLFIEDRQYLSETFALIGTLQFFKSSISAEASQLRAAGYRPDMHDPTFMVTMSALYQPVYGKIAIGSYIQHFKWGIQGGLHAAYESRAYFEDENSSGPDNGSLRFGPNFGTRIDLPLGERVSGNLRAELSLHSSLTDSAGSTSFRGLWGLSMGAGYRL